MAAKSVTGGDDAAVTAGQELRERERMLCPRHVDALHRQCDERGGVCSERARGALSDEREREERRGEERRGEERRGEERRGEERRGHRRSCAGAEPARGAVTDWLGVEWSAMGPVNPPSRLPSPHGTSSFCLRVYHVYLYPAEVVPAAFLLVLPLSLSQSSPSASPCSALPLAHR